MSVRVNFLNIQLLAKIGTSLSVTPCHSMEDSKTMRSKSVNPSLLCRLPTCWYRRLYALRPPCTRHLELGLFQSW
jgi:hypothetical protein